MALVAPTQLVDEVVTPTPATSYTTPSVTPAAGSTVVALVYAYDTNVSGLPVLSAGSGTGWASSGDAWRLIASSHSAQLSFTLWEKRVDSATAGTMTFNAVETCELFGCSMQEWDDDSTHAVLDRNNGIIASGTSTTPSGTLPSTPDEAIGGFFVSIGSEVAFNPGSGFTELGELNAVSGFQHANEYDMAGGGTTVNMTQDVSQLWVMMGFEVRTAETEAMGADSAGTSTDTAAASLTVSIGGTSAGTSVDTATATVTANLAGTSAGSSTDTAADSVDTALAGTGAGTSTDSALADVNIAGTSTSAGTSADSGAITAILSISGTSVGASVDSGADSVTYSIAGTSAGSSVDTGDVTYEGTESIAGTSAGTSTDSATDTATASLTGTSAGTSTDTGADTATASITGTSAGASVDSAADSPVAVLSATSAGASVDTLGAPALAAALAGTSAGTSADSGDVTATGSGATLVLCSAAKGVLFDEFVQAADSTYYNLIATYDAVAQGWQSGPSPMGVEGVCFRMLKEGSPTGTLRVSVYASSGTYGSAIPTGAALVSSVAFDVSTLTELAANYFFELVGWLTDPTTDYFAVLEDVSLVGDGSNYIKVIREVGAEATHGGNAAVKSGGSWGIAAGADQDVPFKLYQLALYPLESRSAPATADPLFAPSTDDPLFASAFLE